MKRLAGLIPAAALVLTVACGQTDAGITTAVKSKLAADDSVSAFQIDVDTANGVVTLTGDVDTATARDRAVMLARDTDGVTDVIDNLELTDTAATTGVDRDTDVDITEGAREIGEAAKEGAREVGEGAERIGEGARDVVTGDDK
jgi:hypothetical protein